MYNIPMKSKFKVIYIFLGVSLIAVGFWLRLYHIEFGLPHSFHADEPEIVELAIKYTYQLRNIISNADYYRLIPISYVYGTFPAYFFTVVTMVFSKSSNFLGHSFDKTAIYVFLRSLSAVLSLSIIPAGVLLYHKLFKNRLGTMLALFLLALNWKLIVHAHYINAVSYTHLTLPTIYSV